MSQGAFSLLAPFYPGIAEKEKGLSSFIIGMVMSSFSVSFVIASYIVGIKISKIGRRFTLYSGIILQSLSMIGFGLIVWIDNKILFIILSFAFRLLGGTACSFICVAAYAMVAIKYRENVQAKISLLEAANGAGLFVGPIFGGLIYQFTHFCVPFFLFTGIFLAFIPFMKRALTSDLDVDDNKESDSNRIGYFKLLKHKRVFFAAMTQFFNIWWFTFGQPIFGPRLSDEYGFSDAIIGVCFALPTVTYILTGPIFLPLITKKFEWRATIMVGFFILIISCLFIGPSRLLGFPQTSSAMMIIGLGILGCGAAFTVIPVIPEMLSAVEGKYSENASEVSDNFSGIFNVAGGFGQIIGPTIAGLLKDEIGFNYTFDFLTLSVLAFNIIYIVIWGGITSMGRSFKATMMRWKKDATLTDTSASHQLLNEESDTPDEAEYPTKREVNDDETRQESIDTSTDISYTNNSNSYTIN